MGIANATRNCRLLFAISSRQLTMDMWTFMEGPRCRLWQNNDVDKWTCMQSCFKTCLNSTERAKCTFRGSATGGALRAQADWRGSCSRTRTRELCAYVHKSVVCERAQGPFARKRTRPAVDRVAAQGSSQRLRNTASSFPSKKGLQSTW